jgi:hypothetical protein
MDKGWRISALLPHRLRAGEKEIEGRRGAKCCSPERKREGHEVAGESPVGGGEVAGGGDGDARETERSTGGGEEWSLWLGLGLEAFF